MEVNTNFRGRISALPVERLERERSQAVSRRDVSLGDVWFSFTEFSVVSMEKWPAAVGNVGFQ